MDTMSTYEAKLGRLLSKARAQSSPCEDRDAESDDSTHSSRGMRKRSWFATRQDKKQSTSTPVLTNKSQSLLHNVSNLLLSASDETPRSSASSWRSEEKNYTHSNTTGTSKPILCPPATKDEGGHPLRQKLGIGSHSGDELAEWLMDNERRIRHTRSNLDSLRLELDLAKSRSSTPQEESSHKSQPSSIHTALELQETVKQLLREADTAFYPVGNGLDQAAVSRTSFNETPKLPQPRRASQPARRASEELKLKKSYRKVRVISPSASVKRANSIKVNRQKSIKARSMKSPNRRSLVAKPASKDYSKWTGNMSELLSGKLFHKIEADEMLTPAQIEAYKLRRLSRIQLQQTTTSQKNSQSADVETATTPVEPFHMDDLPSRIGSSGVKLSPASEKGDPDIAPQVLEHGFPSDGNDHDDELFLTEIQASTTKTTSTSPSPRAPASLPPPIAPQDPKRLQKRPDNSALIQHIQKKTINRYMSRRVPDLPSIKENKKITIQLNDVNTDELFLGHDVDKEDHDIAADDDYIYLRSTRYSASAPKYRHGLIRLAKAGLLPDPKLGADDGLDWTAFQMAILGGAGEYAADNEVILRAQERAEADAICDWWDSSGFGGYGGLITRGKRSSRRSSADSGRSTSTSSDDSGVTINGSDEDDDEEEEEEEEELEEEESHGESYNAVPEMSRVSLYSDIGRDNPYSARHKWQSLQSQAAAEGRRLDLNVTGKRRSQQTMTRSNKNKMNGSSSSNSSDVTAAAATAAAPTKKSWGTDGHIARQSLLSLPQSPMLDLHQITSTNGDVDYVPMGFNLSHDLGDFLSWEAEHTVYFDSTLL